MRTSLPPALVLFALIAACTDRTGGDEVPPGFGGSAGVGGGSGNGGNAGSQTFPFPLPAKIELGGDASGVSVGDVDGDGFRDLAALVKQGTGDVATLVVAFGDVDGLLTDRYEHDLDGSVTRTSRDSASSVVSIADLDGDGRQDLITAAGAALNQGARVFTWKSFGDEAPSAFQPVAFADLGARAAVRGTTVGIIERCDAAGACLPLAGQSPPCAPGSGCTIEDLVVADFDGDSKPDVLGGPLSGAALWASIDLWQDRIPLPALPMADLEAGDVDQDGVADVVAQVPGGDSELWLGTPGGTSPLFQVQTISHHAFGNEASSLADASFDNCLDLTRVSAESPAIAVRLGSFTGDGCLDELGTEWIPAPGVPGAIGIQQLDVNGDGIPEWIVRAPPALRFTPIPILEPRP